MVDVPTKTEFDALAARVTKLEAGGGTQPEPPIQPPIQPPSGDLRPVSGIITLNASNPVLENTRVTGVVRVAEGTQGIRLSNVEVIHKDGLKGIELKGCPAPKLVNVRCSVSDAPPQGPLKSNDTVGIYVERCPRISIERASGKDCSSLIDLRLSEDAVLTLISGLNMRGPMSRGQVVQINNSARCKLSLWEAIGDLTISEPEDHVSVYQSPDCVITKGYIDGNNAITGVGVQVEQGSHRTLVEDIHAQKCMNGAYSTYGSIGVVFRRCNARDSIGRSRRGTPSSGGQNYIVDPSGSGTRIEQCWYWKPYSYNHIIWNRDACAYLDLTEKDVPMKNWYREAMGAA